MYRNWVLVLVAVTVLVVSEPLVEAAPPEVLVNRWHIHVINGLSHGNSLYAHCKSGDNDVGEHYISPGAEIQWSFKENVLGSTLFWCFLRKPGGSVSFEVFWHETTTLWLHYRCTTEGTCFWIAKDDGIYLKNIPDNLQELIHKWNP